MRMTSRTHQGLVRVNNEDCVHIDADAGFAVLADGMGGLLAGEQASAAAVRTVCACLEEVVEAAHNGCINGTEDHAAALVEKAHSAVQDRASELNYVGKMGTTLVLWLGGEVEGYFAHVGDSRLYAYRAGEISQITRDHTVAQRLIDEGTIPAGQERNAPNQNVLTQALGLPGVCEVESGAVPEAERVLLCSDGLSDLVEDHEIAAILKRGDIDECADLLVKAALDRGGRDNVSVVIIEGHAS